LKRGSHHFHKNAARLPVPDQQPVVKLVAALGYHAEKVAAYVVFAISQGRPSGLFQKDDSPVGGKVVWFAGGQRAQKYTVYGF
jgi:hypothetical protein